MSEPGTYSALEWEEPRGQQAINIFDLPWLSQEQEEV